MFISKGYKGIYDLYFTNPSTGKRTKVSTGNKTKREAEKFLWDFARSKEKKPKSREAKMYFSHLINTKTQSFE